jgi:AraC-like DNA-binding protein
MDALAGLLEGPRARGAFLLRTVMTAPWSIRIEDEAPLTIVAIVRGSAWIVSDVDRAPVRLEGGDVALVRGAAHYVVADSATTSPHVIIHPGQRCTTVAGDDLAEAMSLGVRTWGNAPDAGETVMLTGTYQEQFMTSRRLLDALPPVVLVCRNRADRVIVDLLAREIGREGFGQAMVLDRLLDLLVVATLRSWFDEAGVDAPAWWTASNDPVVGPVLRLLSNNPEQPWTIALLAREVGVSRANLARRFNELVGEPPIAYLTNWRLSLAADLICEREATVGSVAHAVGYGSPFALSTAFKRHYGVSPFQYRTAKLAS